MFVLRSWWFVFCLSFRCDSQFCVTFAGFRDGFINLSFRCLCNLLCLMVWNVCVYVLVAYLLVVVLWYVLLDCLLVYLICEVLRAVRLIVWLLYVYSCSCLLCCALCCWCVTFDLA